MNVEQIITGLLAIAPLVAVAVSIWIGSNTSARLTNAEKIGGIVSQLDSTHEPELRSALIEAQEDLLLSYVRRHRWRFGSAGRILQPAAWTLVGIVSAAILQFSNWSESFGILWVLATVGISLGFIGFARVKWIRLWYKDDGKSYLSHRASD